MNTLFRRTKKSLVIFSLALSVITVYPSAMLAQNKKPVNNNPEELLHSCADMQELFNELSWDKDTKFQGFERKKNELFNQLF
jgi:hypothetical protein